MLRRKLSRDPGDMAVTVPARETHRESQPWPPEPDGAPEAAGPLLRSEPGRGRWLPQRGGALLGAGAILQGGRGGFLEPALL